MECAECKAHCVLVKDTCTQCTVATEPRLRWAPAASWISLWLLACLKLTLWAPPSSLPNGQTKTLGVFLAFPISLHPSTNSWAKLLCSIIWPLLTTCPNTTQVQAITPSCLTYCRLYLPGILASTLFFPHLPRWPLQTPSQVMPLLCLNPPLAPISLRIKTKVHTTHKAPQDLAFPWHL